jgi:hypothetical protein
MTTIALFGAGGKIGFRLAQKFVASDYSMHYVEVSPAAIAALEAIGVTVTPEETALTEADVAILAVPDHLIGQIADQIVPRLKRGAMVICLDAAAPYAGQLPERGDISYFVVHPCHPPIPSPETDPEARKDLFGGDKARQHIVCALMQGPESDYACGEEIARLMFAPVMKAHRVTVEQLALLEPALAETVSATCMTVIREAMDEVVRLGVPPEAARDFLLGHINVTIAILFDLIDADFSDGCKLAIERGRQRLFRASWQEVLAPQAVRAEAAAILQGTA